MTTIANSTRLTYRQELAKAAMQGMLANQTNHFSVKELIVAAHTYADTMILHEEESQYEPK